MGIFDFLTGGSGKPSAKQIQRATKAIMQPLGDPLGRYNAAGRLIQWGTEEALYAALQRFTIQLPSITIDQQEKEELSDRLTQCGRAMVQPILKYLRQKTEIRWPCEILRRLVSEEEYTDHLLRVLQELQGRHLRDEEHKARLIQVLSKPADAKSQEVVLSFLEDDNDEVVLSAVEFLASEENDVLRQRLIQLLIQSDERPRVKAWVAQLFLDRNWSVRPHISEVERALPEGFYLTGKGLIRRKGMMG
jgi:hypothetical protein